MKSKIIVHILTGNGKGKTTAAFGLALRAMGAGKRVKIIQFMKMGESAEIKAIRKHKLPIEVESYGLGFYKILGDTHTTEEHKQIVQKAWQAAKKALEAKNYNLIILDEINVAIAFGLLDVDEVIKILDLEPKTNLRGWFNMRLVDVILTGRKAPAKLKKMAHLVSDIKKVKHYFDEGLEARDGIEL